MRCERKIPGGKLVCLEIQPATCAMVVASARLSGDFFLHPEEAITDIESSLVGLPLDSSEEMVCARLDDAIAKKRANLIGVSASDIASMFVKAVG